MRQFVLSATAFLLIGHSSAIAAASPQAGRTPAAAAPTLQAQFRPFPGAEEGFNNPDFDDCLRVDDREERLECFEDPSDYRRSDRWRSDRWRNDRWRNDRRNNRRDDFEDDLADCRDEDDRDDRLDCIEDLWEDHNRGDSRGSRRRSSPHFQRRDR